MTAVNLREVLAQRAAERERRLAELRRILREHLLAKDPARDGHARPLIRRSTT